MSLKSSDEMQEQHTACLVKNKIFFNIIDEDRENGSEFFSNAVSVTKRNQNSRGSGVLDI